MEEIKPFLLKDMISIKAIYTLFYQEKGAGFIFPGETHDFWELLYMDKGYVYLLIDDKGYKVKQGELFFFGRNQNHILWSDSKVAPCFFTLSFDMDFIDAKFFEYRRFNVSDYIKNLFTKIINERLLLFEGDINTSIRKWKKTDNACNEQLLKIYITELMLKLYGQRHSSENAVQSSAIRQKSENMLFNKCLEYINLHINEKLGLDQVCSCIPASRSFVSRVFKSVSGLSVMEYINELKLEKAKRHIRESGLSITEISELLGFSSVYYFSRTFKKKYGISPGQYAKSIKALL